MSRIQKAVIVKLPERYAILNTKGEIVGWARTAYRASETARSMGAKTVEDGLWKSYLPSAT